ncbi:hypothetical protein AO262_30755 [Pseudomonas fluorescens ABAC62]|nr:hypothetical protein AO262_30755 [Pseudomonas fluorescens ABAC62]
MLTLQESNTAALTDGVRIRQMSHHITQIFMALLPKVVINGSSKIVVSLGPRGDEDIFDNVLGVTNIFVEHFDFKHFLSLNRSNQDKLLLEELRRALIVIAERKNPSNQAVDLINSTADATLKSNFKLDVPVKKLSKTSKNKKFKINVFKALNADVGEGWYCEIQTSTKDRVWMHELPGFIDRSDLFKNAELDESKYQVKSRLGKVVFEITI